MTSSLLLRYNMHFAVVFRTQSMLVCQKNFIFKNLDFNSKHFQCQLHLSIHRNVLKISNLFEAKYFFQSTTSFL